MREHNFNHSQSDQRPDEDRGRQYRERTAEEKLLNGEGRFRRQSELASLKLAASEISDGALTSVDKRSSKERRSGIDRRCGYDTRSEVEQFLQGERRSSRDRRSRFKNGYQSFKRARAFTRSLKLRSESEWHDYANSGMRPSDIPADPQNAYAEDGWAGWSDWLGVSPIATHLSLHLFFKKTRNFAHWLGLS